MSPLTGFNPLSLGFIIIISSLAGLREINIELVEHPSKKTQMETDQSMATYTTDRRKISIIEAVLKVDTEDTLNVLEVVLKSAKTKPPPKKIKLSISDFVGFLSKKEADTMRNVIAETSKVG